MKKVLEAIIAGILTIGCSFMVEYIFPLSENTGVVFAFVAFVVVLAILFFRYGSKSIGFGIVAGISIIIVGFLFIIYEASQLH